MDAIFQLQMGEKYEYQLDMSLLWAGDTINTVTWTAPTGLTKTQEAHTDTKATVWFERTAPGLLIVTALVSSAAGRKELITWGFTD